MKSCKHKYPSVKSVFEVLLTSVSEGMMSEEEDGCGVSNSIVLEGHGKAGAETGGD